MKRITTIVGAVLVLFFNNQAKAQGSVGANVGLYKSFKQASDVILGFNLNGKFYINENMRVGANIGYYAKSVLGIRSFIMPITALFEYSFSDNDFSPYIGGDMGIYRVGLSINGNSVVNANFGLAPIVGFDYKLSDHLLLNSNLKIHLIFTHQETTTAFTINAGICYKF